MSKKIMLIISMLLTAALFTGCNAEQLAAWERLTPEQQNQIIKATQKGASGDCYEAIDKHFSGDKNRMKKIVKRESGNNPAAKNGRSSASSCAQLIFSLHGWRYEAVGCNKTQRYDADCNIKAADHLYREQGWRPWKLTDH